MKPLDFIGLVEPFTGRVSSLGIYGRDDGGAISIIGGLDHNSQVTPRTKADAEKLIAWLNEWKEKQP